MRVCKRVKKINEPFALRQRGFGWGHLYLHPVSLPWGLCQCLCSSYLWDKSVLHLFFHQVKYINCLCQTMRLLCIITSFCELKQYFFKEWAVVGVAVLFSPASVLTTQEGTREWKGGKGQQQAAAVMEGLLHTLHNNSIVIWDLTNAVPPPPLFLFPSLHHVYTASLQRLLRRAARHSFTTGWFSKPFAQDRTEKCRVKQQLCKLLFSSVVEERP